MADSNLNTPVIVQATRLDTSILPRNIFSQSYLLYVINQGADVGAIAGKANQAGQGAYDAQVKNDEQDVELADHDARITANTKAINLLEVRLTTAEGKIVVLLAHSTLTSHTRSALRTHNPKSQLSLQVWSRRGSVFWRLKQHLDYMG